MEGFVSTFEAGVTHVLTWYKPNIMFDTEHPAHKKLQEIGKEITTVVKPKAVVVFSAHWAGERDVIEVNTSENADIIYEYV
jgi:4,5-DOPA dioxygenase extradiol